LVSHPDGTGPANPSLYIGGTFQTIGATSAARIARWDGPGHEWSPLAAGADSSVFGIVAFDAEGTGSPMLYAAGAFLNIGGVSASNFARWNGTAWRGLNSG